MQRTELERFAQQLASGALSVGQFVQAVARPLSAPLGEVTLDLDRARRCGFPEVVYGEGKSVETLIKIFRRLLDEGIAVLATRIDAEKAVALSAAYSDGRYNPVARTFRIAVPQAAAATTEPVPLGRVAVVTAGSIVRSWPCRPASVTAPALEDWPRCWECSTAARPT